QLAPGPGPPPRPRRDGPAALPAHGRRQERVATLFGGPDLIQPAPEPAADPQPKPDGRREQAGRRAKQGSVRELLVGTQRKPLAGGAERDRPAEQRAHHHRESDVGHRAREGESGASTDVGADERGENGAGGREERGQERRRDRVRLVAPDQRNALRDPGREQNAGERGGGAESRRQEDLETAACSLHALPLVPSEA